MWRFVPVLAFPISIALLTGFTPPAETANFPFRLHCDHQVVEGARFITRPEVGRIRKAVRILQTVTDYRMTVVACQDITGDGTPELLVAPFAGGVSEALHIFALNPILHRILYYKGGGFYGIKRVKNGPAVLVLDDVHFASYEGLCPDCGAPGHLPLLACFEGGRFTDCTSEYPSLIADFAYFNKVQLRRAVAADADVMNARGSALGVYATYLLMGEGQAGIHTVDKITNSQTLTAWLLDQTDTLERWFAKRGNELLRR
jgi:hypothetical protein